MEKPHIGGISLPAAYAPEQIAGMYHGLTIPTETIRSVHQYFEAASHLYGIISLKHLLHMYNHQNPAISQEEFLTIADIIRHETNDFCVLDMDVLYKDAPATEPLDRKVVSLLIFAFGPKRYYELSDLQTGKAYTVLPRKQFLSYLDPGFYPMTSENLNMLAFLRRHTASLQQSAREILASIQTMIWVGCGLQEVLLCLASTGFHFQSRSERRSFAVLFHAMARHTRTIANRGGTPAGGSGHPCLCLSVHRRMAADLISAARGYISH